MVIPAFSPCLLTGAFKKRHHSSFDDKWLPGLEGGEELAEMNHLMFVAATRAENQAIIIFPRTMAKGDPLDYSVKDFSNCNSRYVQIMARC